MQQHSEMHRERSHVCLIVAMYIVINASNLVTRRKIDGTKSLKYLECHSHINLEPRNLVVDYIASDGIKHKLIFYFV